MAETAAPERLAPPSVALPRTLELGERGFRAVLSAWVLLVGAFLAVRLTAWPPHEDETLALYVGRGTLGELADTVLGERGGAPLHFVLAWIVAHLGGGIGGLRLVSAVCALASIPLVGVLARRLTDRTTAALAAGFAATSWILLFHSVYGRMYTLFLLTSLLSFLALLDRRWVAWVVISLLMVATHPYGALVLGAQAVYVLLARDRVRQAVLPFAVVGVLGIPFWIADVVLAGRFEVGVGGGGSRLGSPTRVAAYLAETAGDFSAGPVLLPVVLALAAYGFFQLPRRARLLVLAVLGVPTLAFLVARLGASTAPETRHLVFALPFFAMLVAAALVALGRRRSPRVAALVALLLLASGVGRAAEKNPLLFLGEPEERVAAREDASAWLAATGRPDDVLLGYEPIYLGAWEESESFSRVVLPRADAGLAAKGLRESGPLGRGVWVLNAHDTTNAEQHLTIPRRLPRPAEAFEARVFGPFLVLRSRTALRSTDEWVEQAAAAMIVGKTLAIGDADINFLTVSRVAEILDYERPAR